MTTPTVVDTPWRRLDPRMLVVTPLGMMVRLLPAFAILIITGGGNGDLGRLIGTLVAIVLIVLLGVVRWRTTRYRITPDRVELHSGWLRRQRRSVPRDRIRTVDLTAKLEHRLFGLSVVKVGSASGSSTEHHGLSLDAVSKAEADLLRRELLEHAPAGPPTGAAVAVAAPVFAEVLARLDWSWLRFAPLTFSSLAGVGVIVAAAFNILNDLGVDPTKIGAVDDAAVRLTRGPIWAAVAVIAVILLVTAVLGALLLFTERWFGYRLTRERSGEGSTLRVYRGLFTRRSLSVAERRMRGAEIVEPLLLRAGRGAQCRALSAGLARDAQGGVLQPPVPRAEAHRVASAVLREHPSEITGAVLRRHPRSALTRRMTRALGPTAVLVVVAFVAGSAVPWLAWAGPTSVVLLSVAALVGWDRYRNLGHELTARYLVGRQGSVARRTVALQRSGVIGWSVRQSIFQRRVGLVTLEAVTGAGSGGYEVLDLAAADAAALADAAVPDLLTPFLLVPAHPGRARRSGLEH